MSDRRSGRIFSTDELCRKMPGPLLSRLPCHNKGQPMDAGMLQFSSGRWPPLRRWIRSSDSSGRKPSTDLNYFSSSLRDALGSKRDLLISRDLLATPRLQLNAISYSPRCRKARTTAPTAGTTRPPGKSRCRLGATRNKLK